MREQSRVLPGMMYMFYYNPKHEQTLPYYDSFPLVILLNTDSKGMEGLNLHYLPLNLRQKLFYGLLNRMDSVDIDEASYLRITYDYLKGARSLKEYKPCYKISDAEYKGEHRKCSRTRVGSGIALATCFV